MKTFLTRAAQGVDRNNKGCRDIVISRKSLKAQKNFMLYLLRKLSVSFGVGRRGLSKDLPSIARFIIKC
jgi:hypothetical protein